MTNHILTQERLKQVLIYHKETGIFTRLVNKKGSVAGYVGQKGYLQTTIDAKTYRLHRLAWLYEFGYMPSLIDHKDGNKKNNKLENLRQSDVLNNNQNIKKPRNDNNLKILGVSKSGAKFRAYIRVFGIKKYIGTFNTENEAGEAYLEYKKKLHDGYIE